MGSATSFSWSLKWALSGTDVDDLRRADADSGKFTRGPFSQMRFPRVITPQLAREAGDGGQRLPQAFRVWFLS